ncbi:CRISPR system precrRNA processing endoribonuclease RAMP protein Cas6 [Clostridium sp. Marseille-P2415]|uniref:CRISPR system precrRNA processing endoribonuclease RAMP protein Cas6 n=1 Tax=Clostridium sp. Marseille-P2415 TaxID=1805471 RepID=UPI001F197636|nr:CRISPR system precrRNA processing endoribonuclease RAMP protein Cas6 [Clostridium sp. Marseille-P2415]
MSLKSGTLPPYLGSTVRGIMGHCFREFVCTASENKCFLCEKRENCLYVKYFSNTGKEAGAINPYAIYVLKDGKTEWREGEECVFDLTLFGHAAEEAGIYLDAILAMEEKGWGVSRLPFKLIRVTDAKTGKLIYAQGRTWLRNLTYHLMDAEEREARTVFVSFDTPLRIVTGKELCSVPSFSNLIQFISRRFSLISQIYTDQRLEWNENAILDMAEKVKISGHNLRHVNFGRYSINQKGNRLELPAVEGWILYEGDLTFLTPILEAGKYLHVGKGATIGFGHYETFYDR